MTKAATSAGVLAGRTVLITRPRHQSGALADLVRRSGGEPIVFSTLEIQPVDPTPAMREVLARLPEFDMAIFVSANAVQHAMPLIRGLGGWPHGVRAAAVGQGTARELRAQGVADVLLPGEGADSEALLARPELQAVTGQRIVIFRGVGGRELLADTLRGRGAEVVYFECYRRSKPAVDPGPVRDRVSHHALDAVVCASAQSLRNLLDIAGSEVAPKLTAVPLFVVHPNIAEAARALGFSRIVVTETSDQGVLSGIIAFLSQPA
jgi:uroporphyrinogen-III synthase